MASVEHTQPGGDSDRKAVEEMKEGKYKLGGTLQDTLVLSFIGNVPTLAPNSTEDIRGSITALMLRDCHDVHLQAA